MPNKNLISTDTIVKLYVLPIATKISKLGKRRVFGTGFVAKYRGYKYSFHVNKRDATFTCYVVVGGQPKKLFVLSMNTYECIHHAHISDIKAVYVALRLPGYKDLLKAGVPDQPETTTWWERVYRNLTRRWRSIID
jgi:hypothetical protein